jgi:hypothetical protein
MTQAEPVVVQAKCDIDSKAYQEGQKKLHQKWGYSSTLEPLVRMSFKQLSAASKRGVYAASFFFTNPH